MEKNKYKILIVDDDTFLLDMYAIKFKERDFEVIATSNSDEALDKLKDPESSIDIILLDLVMPNVDGFGILKKIGDEKLSPQSLLIVLSNLGEASDMEKAKNMGADGYIIKASATPSEVVDKVITTLEKKK